VLSLHFRKKKDQDCEFQKVTFLLLSEFDQYMEINVFSALKLYKTAADTKS